MKHKFLIISEENGVHNKIIEYLETFMEVYYTSSMHEALVYLTMLSYQLIVIEVEKDGEKSQRFIQTIRKISMIPILVIVSEIEKEKLMYVQAGADLVITDSSNHEEVRLHLYAMIRRYVSGNENSGSKEHILHEGSLIINRIFRRAFWNGQELELTKYEFDFLHLITSAPRQVYTYEQVHEIVWKEESQGDINNILWCFTHRLRKKLKAQDPRAEKIIKCARNVGYYFEPIEDIP